MKSKNYVFKSFRSRKKYVRLLRKHIKYVNFTGPKLLNKGVTVNSWSKEIYSRFIWHGNKKASSSATDFISKSIYHSIKEKKKLYWVIMLPPSHQKADFIFSSIKKHFF